MIDMERDNTNAKAVRKLAVKLSKRREHMLTGGITCLLFALIGMGVAIGGAVYLLDDLEDTNLVTTNYNSIADNTLTFTECNSNSKNRMETY